MDIEEELERAKIEIKVLNNLCDKYQTQRDNAIEVQVQLREHIERLLEHITLMKDMPTC